MSIYSIECKCGKCYVGSTSRTLNSRANEHRSEFVNPNRKSFYSPVYTHFRECGLEQKDMKLSLLHSVIESENIKKKESEWIATLGELNQYDAVPNFGKYLARRDRAKIKGQVIHECECGGTWSHNHHARHKRSLKHTKFIKNKILVNNINGEEEKSN